MESAVYGSSVLLRKHIGGVSEKSDNLMLCICLEGASLLVRLLAYISMLWCLQQFRRFIMSEGNRAKSLVVRSLSCSIAQDHHSP